MTDFATIPLNDIIIDRDGRQRTELRGVAELAESIRQFGLINPVLIDRTNRLVAGEHRIEAFRLLGFYSIPVHYTDEQDELTLHVLELEENVRRTDLEWKDRTRAIVAYHNTQKERDPEWNQEKTAASLQISSTHIGRFLLVHKMIEDKVPEVVEAAKFSTAANFAERKLERTKTGFLRDLGTGLMPGAVDGDDDPNTPPTATTRAPTPQRATIEKANFVKWANTVQTQPFNLIHCDFPYGVSAGNTSGQSAAKTLGGYADTADIYFELLATICKDGPNFIAPSAHMLFWFSMDYYQQTVDALRAADWRVDPFPLIWHKSDNAGIIPDANRGPRRTYETALFCTRGDRKIVRAVSNSTATATTKHYHMSEKAEIMLAHFFRMLVDETTRMLDPTCGSGMAVKVAEAAGADYSLGLEMNADYVEGARQNLERGK